MSTHADFYLEFHCVREATPLFNSDQSPDVTELNCYSSWSFKSSTVITTENVASTHQPNRGFTPMKLARLELLTFLLYRPSGIILSNNLAGAIPSPAVLNLSGLIDQ